MVRSAHDCRDDYPASLCELKAGNPNGYSIRNHNINSSAYPLTGPSHDPKQRYPHKNLYPYPATLTYIDPDTQANLDAI